MNDRRELSICSDLGQQQLGKTGFPCPSCGTASGFPYRQLPRIPRDDKRSPASSRLPATGYLW